MREPSTFLNVNTGFETFEMAVESIESTLLQHQGTHQDHEAGRFVIVLHRGH